MFCADVVYCSFIFTAGNIMAPSMPLPTYRINLSRCQLTSKSIHLYTQTPPLFGSLYTAYVFCTGQSGESNKSICQPNRSDSIKQETYKNPFRSSYFNTKNNSTWKDHKHLPMNLDQFQCAFQTMKIY